MLASEIGRIFSYGSQLDAWAAKVSRHLGQQLPEYGNQLEKNRLDEIVHARVLVDQLKKYAPDTPFCDPGYATMIGLAAMSDRPLWNATVLNFVERRSEVQFRLAWRHTRSADLLQIANDEKRHVKFGREILKAQGLDKGTIIQVLKFVCEADKLTGTNEIHELDYLNWQVAEELAEL